ncbi:hypothetical protein GDO86_011084, partial [Hymenochirus boettgeri]
LLLRCHCSLTGPTALTQSRSGSLTTDLHGIRSVSSRLPEGPGPAAVSPFHQLDPVLGFLTCCETDHEPDCDDKENLQFKCPLKMFEMLNFPLSSRYNCVFQ